VRASTVLEASILDAGKHLGAALGWLNLEFLAHQVFVEPDQLFNFYGGVRES
jgi:hypothetical protein